MQPLLHNQNHYEFRDATFSEFDYSYCKVRVTMGDDAASARGFMLRTERPMLFNLETDPELADIRQELSKRLRD